MLSTSASAAGGACAAAFLVGDRHRINLTASDIRSRHVVCPAALQLVRAYLSKKANQASEACAPASLCNPAGCGVGGFACRDEGRIRGLDLLRQEWSQGERQLWFRERDEDDG